MNNIIVVIGSVTAKQYGSLRLKLLREGLRPKIVRLPADLFPIMKGEDLDDDYVSEKRVCNMFGVSRYEFSTGMVGYDDLYVPLLQTDFGLCVKDVHSVILPPKGKTWNGEDLAHIFRQAHFYRVHVEGVIPIEDEFD